MKAIPFTLASIMLTGCTIGGPLSATFDDTGAPDHEIASALSVDQKLPRYTKIRDAARARGIENAYLLAGIANDETGLAMCWSEATWACQGPASPDCGGGPVIAGAGDGPCSAQQGGLGMFQFDAGTYAQTIAQYGSGILTVDGQIPSAIDFAVGIVQRSIYTTNAETPEKARAWINNFDPNDAVLRDQWIKTVVRYYNGCPPTNECWNSRVATYTSSLNAAIADPGGFAFWRAGGGGGGAIVLGRAGDFDGDGKADLTTFVRGDANTANQGHVYVSLSTGAGFAGASVWQPFFSIGREIPAIGDFDGDGKSDIATFVRGDASTPNQGHVYVARSNGTGFGGGELWQSFFSIGNEVPAVGDFNGDGKDDIATFVRGDASTPNQGHVYVALSTGSAFGGAQVWATFFSIGNEVPAVGDFNGDGKDDIATFVRGDASTPNQGHVYVALSTGSGFAGAQVWATFFSIGNELPVVGDFNGDGKADIATFVRGDANTPNQGHVYVALSTGSGFAGASVWHPFFSITDEVPGAGDFNGDGKADVVTFTRGDAADVYTGFSNGTSFVGVTKVSDLFAAHAEIPAPASVPL